MSDQTIISVQDLTKTYQTLTAVDHISFDVNKGEIFGFLGPNGAGKTTTLEIIETLRDKTSGIVIVGGYSLDESPEKIKSIIGVQLQSAGFMDGITLSETLSFFSALYNVHIKPKELLAKVHLEEKAKSKVKELSGGQKQRFSIATTLVHQPEILFLDEPSTGLDPQARHNLWDLIKEIRNNGTTIVLTTHFMDEAEILCDRVAIIDEGKVLTIDSPAKLVDDLIAKGFTGKKTQKIASLEDVFLEYTGKELRD